MQNNILMSHVQYSDLTYIYLNEVITTKSLVTISHYYHFNSPKISTLII